jgi:hypothetical protein
MSVVLRGLDASNPLAFLASLGLLRVLDFQFAGEAADRPRLSFVEEGRWHPSVEPAGSVEELVDAVINDLPSWSDEPALALAYTKGKDGERRAAGDKGAVADLKPPNAVMREYLDEMAERAVSGFRRSADVAAAFGTDVALDNQGMTKPTAFHFTAGQQTFLKMAAELREGLRPEHVVEALAGPWKGVGKLPSFSWDATAARIYALRATNPSDEKRGSVPGAEWLALLGLSFLPVFPKGVSHPRTTAVTGGWKNGAFTWPVWTIPATAPVVMALLALGDLASATPAEREARGIAVGFRSGIGRKDQGGYGFFNPAEVV